MPEQAVQLKMKAEGIDPNIISDPNAPAPPPDENKAGGGGGDSDFDDDSD